MFADLDNKDNLGENYKPVDDEDKSYDYSNNREPQDKVLKRTMS